MSLLFNVLFAWKASGTHHKLALDALRHLRIAEAEPWRNLFLSQADVYLAGSKAPDNKFKDFCNHVLHVRDNYWGGAIAAARDWYDRTVTALRAQQWPEAVTAAGVLSHYYTDPLMPFHTGQTEEEGSVHRALEWSVAKSYEDLRALLETDLGGWPDVPVPAGADWLDQMVRHGAECAHVHYDALIDHYDLSRGVKNPPAGLDTECRRRLAPLLGHAAVGFARILDRAITDAAVSPPPVNLTVQSVVVTLNIPVAWVTKKMQDAGERAVVQAMYQEFQQSGKVVHNLPDDDKMVRQRHAAEVLKMPLAVLDALRPRPIGSKHGTSSAAPVAKPSAPPKPSIPAPEVRTYLSPDMPVEDAPSIGPKTGERLRKVGVRTVADLLALEPDDIADQIGMKHITAVTLRDWQAQARLVCQVPGLRGHDAQILVACEIRDRAALAGTTADQLLPRVEAFVASKAGLWVVRSGKKPDREEITNWIAAA